jgi:hypothetical protein
MRKKKNVISNTGKFFCFNNNVSNLYNNSVVEKINGMAYIFTRSYRIYLKKHSFFLVNPLIKTWFIWFIPVIFTWILYFLKRRKKYVTFGVLVHRYLLYMYDLLLFIWGKTEIPYPMSILKTTGLSFTLWGKHYI